VVRDLQHVMHLHAGKVELQLARNGSGGMYERYRDALPDGGGEPDQRRVRGEG